MGSDFNKIAQQLIDAHPESVHQLLRSKGILKQATPQVLLDAYILFGKPFISDLADISFQPASNFGEDLIGMNIVDSINTAIQNNTGVVGPTVTNPPATASQAVFNQNVAVGTQKKDFWDTLADIFDSAAAAGTAINTAIQNAKGATQQNVSFQTAAEQKKQAEEKQAKTVFIIGIIVTVVLIAIVIFVKNKS